MVGLSPEVAHRTGIPVAARQGEAMGRPGVARVWIGCDGRKPREVRVSGDAVLVFTTTIDI